MEAWIRLVWWKRSYLILRNMLLKELTSILFVLVSQMIYSMIRFTLKWVQASHTRSEVWIGYWHLGSWSNGLCSDRYIWWMRLIIRFWKDSWILIPYHLQYVTWWPYKAWIAPCAYGKALPYYINPITNTWIGITDPWGMSACNFNWWVFIDSSVIVLVSLLQ